jgi:molybdopterin synthase catalytic subunit
LWMEVHGLKKEAFDELKKNLPLWKKVEVDDVEKSQVEDYLLHHLDEDILRDLI